MTSLISLPDDILEVITDKMGINDIKSMCLWRSTHRNLSKPCGCLASICDRRGSNILEQYGVKVVRSDETILGKLKICRDELRSLISAVGLRVRAGHGVIWTQCHRTLEAAYALKDYGFLRRHLQQIIDIYLKPRGSRTYAVWAADGSPEYRQRMQENRRCYEESILLIINNCLQAVQDKSGPYVFTDLLSNILNWGFRREGVPGVYMRQGTKSCLYRKVVDHYLNVRSNYIIRQKYAKRIVITGPPV